MLKWDPRKAAANLRKHGVHFADAVTVLEDERAIAILDESAGEERWVTIGVNSLGQVLVVVYARHREKIRIISARRATSRERSQYLEQP